ncbi:MAG TPA: hypothetical protein VHR66_14870, partial [Gemmataceae bacterium]|nr:hypothetical protein [Gemmataceae bacterium]
EVNQAHLIVFGTLSNAQRDPEQFGKGTTDLDIEMVVKDNEFLKGKKKITLPRYVPADPKKESKHLIFCEIYKGEIDPYRGEAVAPDSKIAEYLKGAIALKDKDMPTRLAYFFKHFDAADWAVSGDAFQEFSNAEYKDVRVAAAKLDAEQVLKMLKDPSTSTARLGLLGLIFGHCGKGPEHAKALRAFIDDPKVKQATGLDGLLAGYVLLDPKEGLAYVQGVIKDTKEDFLVRYAALRCMRFIWEYREDVLKKADIVAAITPLVDQPDISDLAVEDLRKWEQWNLADKLVGLFDKPSHDVSIIQRSIIKYALTAPASNKTCADFLVRMRADAKQAERVRDLEQLLELEKPRPVVPAQPKK